MERVDLETGERTTIQAEGMFGKFDVIGDKLYSFEFSGRIHRRDLDGYNFEILYVYQLAAGTME